MLFRSALFPNKNAPIATATITIVTTPVTDSSIGSEDAVFASVCDGEDEGDELDAVVVDGLGDCVEVGDGVVIGAFGFGTASGFGEVKMGVKVTMPTLLVVFVVVDCLVYNGYIGCSPPVIGSINVTCC